MADQDSTDALPIQGDEPGEDGVTIYARGASGGGRSMPLTESDYLAEKYKMDYPNRGLALIFNNRDFEAHTQKGSRKGTDVDAAQIFQRLKKLHFEVKMHSNKTRREMKDLMRETAKMDHSNNDCFVCVILSHGEEGAVYGTDGLIEIKELVDPFKGHMCTSLAGKPKLFFIQACRGQELDHGTDVADALGVQGDGDEEMTPVTYRIPTEADFLMAYSVVPGYFSWRNPNEGSWFIQTLCNVLEKYGTELDLMTMMTRVNKIVAHDFESKTNQEFEFMNRKKQMPCIISMLTKDLYFPPKQLSLS